MDTLEKRNRKSPGAGGAAKNQRKRSKNGMKIKEEKNLNTIGPDPGGGGVPNLGPNLSDLGDGPGGDPKGGLPDELMLNGTDIKMENPSTPLLDSKSECPDIPPLSDLGHPDFPDCKPPMNPYCYPYNNNMPPNNSPMPPHPSGPGDYGPPSMMGNFGPSGPPTKQQPSTLEAQYMQQQSQIFVFSTKLANKAAEAVFQGQFASIINFHTSQPATRKFLEVNQVGSMQQSLPKNPFKMNNFGRQFQGGPNWPPPPGPPSKKGKTHHNQHQQQQMGMPGPPPNMPPDFNMHPGGPPPNWNAHSSPPQKPGQQPGYPNFYNENGPFGGMGPQQGPNPGSQMMGPGPGPPGPPGAPMPSGQLPGYFPGGPNHQPPGGGGPQGPMPTGIKIPDENLTPQQRLHREEQLAKMRTMQKLLFPENDHSQGPGDPGCHPMPPHDNMNPYDMPGGPQGQMNMDYGPNHGGMNGPGGKPMGNDWSGPPNSFFMDGPNKGPHHPPGPPIGNGPRSNKMGGGSIPSPATPLTPGSSCGPHHRPSPHSPVSSDPMYPGGGPGGGGHSFYPQGYYSPQVGQVQDNSPSTAVQRKDSESSNSEGGKSRKDKSSCSISPTSSAPPSVKEANLMPVPSPQQIQYLNVFEGQELTIQKQPNVGLSEHNNDHSPGMPPSIDMNPPTPNMKPSHSAPPTPVSMVSMNPSKSNSDMSAPVHHNNKNRPGSVGPVPTPKSSTTPNPSPQGPDRSSSQPGTPLQMNFDNMKNQGPNFGGPSGMGPGGGPGGQPPCNMMNKGSGMPMGMDGPHPDGGPVFDNVPLNPNLSGPGPPGNKPAFDPISSMVQMSQQLTGGNGTPPNPPVSSMGNNSGYGMNPPNGPPMNPNMVNFNASMHGVQNVDGGMAIQPQTVNNTYVNATMTIQQMNISNIPPYPMGNQQMNHQMGGHMQMGPGSGHMPQIQGGPMQNQPQGPNGPMGMGHGGPGPGGPMGMGPGGPNSGGPMGMGPNGPNSGGPGPMGSGPMGSGPMGSGPMGSGPMGSGPMGSGPMGSGPMGSGPMGPGPMNSGPMGSGPMGGPPMGPMGQMCSGPRGPGPMMYGNQSPRMGQNARSSPYRMPGGANSNNPRAFGGTNIQVKPNAPNTIQYLPARPPPPHNQGPMCPQSGAMPGGPGGPRGPNLDFLQRYTNPSPGPVVNVNMGMNVNVNMNSNRMPGYPGPPPGMNSNGPHCDMMRGQHPPPHMMNQGPPPGGPMNSGQSMPPGMMNPGMKGPGGYPGPGGPQQGPPPSDPAYQQQFHHFQQQLYATGTNSGRNPNMPPNMPPNPNTPPNQGFFK